MQTRSLVKGRLSIAKKHCIKSKAKKKCQFSYVDLTTQDCDAPGGSNGISTSEIDTTMTSDNANVVA